MQGRLLRSVALAGLALSAPSCRAPAALPHPHRGAEMEAVPHPGDAPFSSVCRLEVRRRQVNGLVVTEEAAVSTGALVGQNQLLTVAHNFASPPHTPVTGRAMECGRSGHLAAWTQREQFQREDLHVAAAFQGGAEHDYAMLRVGEAAPFGPGLRLPRSGERALRVGDTVHVAGYALDHREFDGRRLYHGTGRIRAASRDSSLFLYDVETRGGMSGAPVWVVRRGADGRPEYVVVGVHVGRHRVDGRLWALARRVGGDALRDLRLWIAADSARG